MMIYFTHLMRSVLKHVNGLTFNIIYTAIKPVLSFMPILNRALHTETLEELLWKEHDDCVFQIYPVQILHPNRQVSRVIPI